MAFFTLQSGQAFDLAEHSRADNEQHLINTAAQLPGQGTFRPSL